MSDSIEVTFSVAPAVRRSRYHDPWSLDPEEHFTGYRFTESGVLEDGTPLREHLRRHAVASAYVEAGATEVFDLTAAPGFVWLTSGPALLVDGAPGGRATGIRLRAHRRAARAPPREGRRGSAADRLHQRDRRPLRAADHQPARSLPVHDDAVPLRRAPALPPDVPRALRRRDDPGRRRAGGEASDAALHRPAGIDRPVRPHRRHEGLRARAHALRPPPRVHRGQRRRAGEDHRRRRHGELRRARGCPARGTRHARADRALQPRTRAATSSASRSGCTRGPASP